MKQFTAKITYDDYAAQYFVLAEDKKSAQKRIYEITKQALKVTEK